MRTNNLSSIVNVLAPSVLGAGSSPVRGAGRQALFDRMATDLESPSPAPVASDWHPDSFARKALKCLGFLLSIMSNPFLP